MLTKAILFGGSTLLLAADTVQAVGQPAAGIDYTNLTSHACLVLIVIFLVTKFIPGILAKHSKAMEKQAEIYTASATEQCREHSASLEKTTDRFLATVDKIAEQHRQDQQLFREGLHAARNSAQAKQS